MRGLILALACLLVLGVQVGAPAGGAAQALSAQRALIAARYPRVRWVETATVARWMAAQSSPEASTVIFLDAREAEEFEVSHLDGARRVDPDLENVASLGIPEGARVVVYCSVGWRSGALADRIRRSGHRDVFNLEGGIFRWANEGRAIRDATGPVTKVHPYDATWGLMLDDERRAPPSGR